MESSTVGYLDEYTDLIGMVSMGTYYELGNIRLRIVGVVESDTLTAYLDSLTFTRLVLSRYMYMPVTYASNVGLTLPEGQVAVIDEGMTSVDNKVGATVTVNGLELTVGQVFRHYNDLGQYPDYVQDVLGEKLILTPEEYRKTLPEGTDETAAFWEWLLDHYFKHIPSFYQTMLQSVQPHDDILFEEWAVASRPLR